MKKNSYLLIVCILTTLTSCLEAGLETLPEFEGNSILSVRKVEYRFKGQATSGVSGESYLEYLTLSHVAQINKEKKQVNIQVTVPAVNSVFTSAEREKCTTKALAVMLSIETAAKIQPMGDAPKLGVPGDWTKPNRYTVTAANGDVAEWVIEITEFHK